MSNWSKKRDAVPEKSNPHAFKEFIKAKYEEKRFAEKVQEASDSSDSEEERRVRKAKKKSRKDKIQKRVASSSDDDHSAPIEAPVRKTESKKESRKLGAPPGSKNAFAPVTQPKVET
jgi:uncharacterized protein YktA (UPF0223 family)